jgi:phosphatidylglycerophosphate synthase
VLDFAAALFDRLPVTANQVTIIGFLIGVTAVPLLAFQHYGLALTVILTNRFLDGMDGAIARRKGASDLGGYLDIVLDFIFYSAVVFGFAIGDPTIATYAAFLIFSFVATGTTFLAYSVFAAKRGLTTDVRGTKSIYYLGGLTEGFETIVALALLCLAPTWFWLIASIFGTLCWVTAAHRVSLAFQTLSSK